RFVNAFRQTSDFPAESLAAPPVVPGLDLSDHRSFWQHDFPAIMVTDTAFYRNERYHTALDTPDTVCYPELAQVTLGVATALSSLGAKA
ncbi:MAG: M28 family peptidase, partial [Gammaproteobacteria bacterium]|nr:M28 family peptidase [Gammaproteobacteria bacterium]